MNDKSKDDAGIRSKSAPKRAGRKPLEKTQPSVCIHLIEEAQ